MARDGRIRGIRSPVRAACALVWAITSATGPIGCSTQTSLIRGGLAGARGGANVVLLATRGAYLDVIVDSGGTRYRFFLPDDEACRSLSAGEGALTYANTGIFGRLRADPVVCDPVGVLSLREWRDLRPHRQAAAVIPRDQAALRERVFADEELALVRGRFRLAVQIGLMGGEDMIAVLPNTPECAGLTVPGVASMEFRPAGARVFSLINGRQLCPVIGFVIPDSSPAP